MIPPDVHGFDGDEDGIGCDDEDIQFSETTYPEPGEEDLTPTTSGLYPGPGSEVPTQPPGDGYPGPGTEQPTQTSVFVGPPATQTPVFVGPSLTPTPQGSPGVITLPTLTLTPSQTPTRTPYLTPTPSRTLTPTRTPTPFPLPPWMSSELHATDPRTVRLASGEVQLVEFFAFWCGACQAMAPTIHNLEERYETRMNFIYLDIDDPANDYFKEQLDFRYEPHFILLDAQGKILDQWIGYVSDPELRAAIETALR